jgi:hypothetical protein
MGGNRNLSETVRDLDYTQHWRDFLLLFLIPSAVLIVIFLLPRSEQILEYEARNPTIVGILGSNLAHRSVSHISGNIVGYWILGGTGLLLMKQSDSAHVYRYAFVAYLLILPFFASWTILRIFSGQPSIIARFESVGFSQTVGAVTGFLPIAVACYHSELTESNYALQTSLGLFTLGFSVAFYNLDQVSTSVKLLMGIGFVSLLYMGYQLVKSLETLVHPKVVYLLGAVVLFISGLQSLFPQSTPPGIYGHMAGYVWGYLLPVSGITGVKIYTRVRNRALINP